MKELLPHHAENHGLAPGPGRASKLLTPICFIESEGGKNCFARIAIPFALRFEAHSRLKIGANLLL
jgi:hypothetical protein